MRVRFGAFHEFIPLANSFLLGVGRRGRFLYFRGIPAHSLIGLFGGFISALASPQPRTNSRKAPLETVYRVDVDTVRRQPHHAVSI